MSWLIRSYERIVSKYPVTFQALQTGVIISAGDVISQTLVEKKSLRELDLKRTLQFFGVGTLYVGPALTVWYRILDKYVGTGGKYFALKKMAFDQVCFAPVCLAGFIVIINTAQGKNLAKIKSTFTDVYPDILLANYKIWPAVQLINFYYVPLHYQVLYVQCVALLWNTYICYKTKPE